MKTIAARELQKNFGTISDLVTSGESVRVTRYGRPGFIMIPENSETETVLRRLAGRRLVKNLQNSKATDAAKALTQDEINQMINDCFA